MDGLCRPCKDTAIEAFLPARTEPDPGRIPRGTQTPTYFTRHILPPKKESTALSCISKANGTLVFSLPKKDHVGSAHHWFRKKKIYVSRKPGTDKPWNPEGSTFRCTRGGTVGNSTTYSPGRASWHLGVSTNPQLSTFLSPCYVSSTVLPI